MFRLGSGELAHPLFGSERFEVETRQNIIRIQERVANDELVQLYLMALDRKSQDQKSKLSDPFHKVGDILLEYFQGEGQAICYLSKVSLRALLRLTHHERRTILADKVADHAFIRGPNFKWRDDVWRYIYEVGISLDFDSPHPAGNKKRKRDLDDEFIEPPYSVDHRKRPRTIEHDDLFPLIIID
jgi:hypothetical protein